MGTIVLSCLGFVLSAALVYRAMQQGWWRAYPVVFGYSVAIAAHFLGAWWVRTRHPEIYPAYYWSMEGLFVVLGFGLIWQVYAAIPRQYPGVGRIIKMLAQKIAAFGPVLVVLAVLGARQGTVTLDILERDFRAIQAILIVVVFGLAMYYHIPLSRNLNALVRGYGLYIVVFIVRYTLWPMDYSGFWPYVLPVAYLAAQGIWLMGLWRYENPAEEGAYDGELEQDTYAGLARLRRQLGGPFSHG